ncbi:MAG: glutaredoxin family protein [Gammaproteobacteria bacterium]|nr:glutaredoxin family protein [Gammaproteobacteria bacterium]MBU1440181.1 glutaredoxin family protein [Gammaproteobacteria bacterium]MBU2288220.1 glutaredoxin family protein [Gammaproteobacteria bacterium]MBU2409764.1 glutaredoxin family protein [Gammaproteobacteria bacterium]
MEFRVRYTAIGLAMLAGVAAAQPIYRQVDKNGKVTFSDQPPAADVQPATPRAGITPGANAALPYELRQVVQRYPVTIYTSDECGGCAAGRSLLVTRGVPFDERTVKSNEDIDALEKLSGQTSLPLLAIGAQQLKGFSDAEWSQYLDAAGYPKSNSLPTGFQNPSARPLVAVQPAKAPPPPRAASAPPPPAAPPPESGPTPSNPAGIKF